MLKNIFIALSLVVMFTACGDDSSPSVNASSTDGTDIGTTDTRVKNLTVNWDFTSSNTITTDSSFSTNISLDEAVVNLAQITSDYTVVLGGEDAVLFDLTTTTTGQSLTFKQATNFNLPTDIGQDNTYKIELSLENEAQSTFVLSITFNVRELAILTNYSKVSKTGQTVSALDFDDAYYAKGVDKNLTRTSEMVTDHLSGLVWQDNNESASLNNGLDFTTANTYCTGLTLGGLTWRVPSTRELNTITNYSTTESIKTDTIFINKRSDYPFVSSDDYNATHHLQYSYGNAVPYIKGNSELGLIRCVSSANDLVVLVSDLSRDDTNKVVIDNKNNLMWQDDVQVTTNIDTWSNAIDYCKILNMGGHTDWRLPQIFELVTLIDDTQIHATYINDSASIYWSSTSDPSDSIYAATINTSSNSGFEGWGKAATKNIRCVRDFQ